MHKLCDSFGLWLQKAPPPQTPLPHPRPPPTRNPKVSSVGRAGQYDTLNRSTWRNEVGQSKPGKWWMHLRKSVSNFPVRERKEGEGGNMARFLGKKNRNLSRSMRRFRIDQFMLSICAIDGIYRFVSSIVSIDLCHRWYLCIIDRFVPSINLCHRW